MRPASGSARARLDFTDVETPDTKSTRNKENAGETAANAQGNRENNLYQALMQNELQGFIIIALGCHLY